MFHSRPFLICFYFCLAGFVNVPFASCDTETPYEVCYTAACNETAEEILSGMDKNTEPCVDFYNFVCKNWRDENPDLPGVDVRNQFVNAELNMLLQMKALLDAPEEPHETIGMQTARKLYAACIDEEIDEIQATKLLDILAKTGGWPLIDHTINVTDNSWQKIDFLFLRNYATTWVYDLTLTQHKYDKKRYVLTVKPPTIKWPPYMKVGDTLAKDKYAHFVLKVIKSLMEEEAFKELDRQVLWRDIHDVLDFEESLIKISSPLNVACSHNEETLRSLQKLFGLVSKYARIDWITRITTVLRIPPDELIYVTCDKYIEKLVTLLKSTPEKVVVNYIYWSFVVQVWPLVVQSLRNEFYPKNEHKPRWRQCIEENEAATSIYFRLLQKKFPDSMDKKALDIYEMVDAEAAWRFLSFKDRLRGSPLRLDVYNRHEKVSLHFKKPRVYFNETDYRKRFPIETIQPTYVENIISRIKYRNVMDIARIRSEYKSTPRQLVATYESKIIAGTFPKNRYIPAGILQIPFYHPDRPQTVNYAAFGSIVGYSIMKEYYEYLVASYYGKSGITHFPEESKTSFVTNAKDILAQWNVYPLKISPAEKVIDPKNLRKMYYHIAERDGLQMAFKAYKRDFSLRNWKDVRLPGLEKYNHLQLFFLAYTNAHCASYSRLQLKTVEELSRAVIGELDMPARRKVLLSLLQTQAFAEVFKCKKGSWMYPVRGAPYW